MAIYAGAVSCERLDNGSIKVRSTPVIIRAHTEAEAYEAILEAGMVKFPRSGGWSGYRVSVIEVPAAWLTHPDPE